MPLFPILLLAAQPAMPTPAPPPVQAEMPPAVLTDQVAAADARFFAAFFDARCNPAEVRAMIADDFEMYHDKGGVIATSADQFMALYASQCAERAKPDAWRSRRELVPGSLLVDPVPGFGAIEEGDHRFYERQGEGAETLAGSAHFAHLWEKTPQGWKLKRVLSYSHRKAP
ncbi:nuclear transport factor 2 family protein [Novosphingobium sp.]|uniref:nuclear transport factor 2 family protein n=1 Tax=Novosphingobium sp. TaxID=1874826 RepID=UPI002735F226|nr:nuclear transport factor 2 family protein [Novosphingobium sp.]MDP3908454.1 nuclear transport factor 2 family protein [Novosphingobium sp.]